MSRVLAFANHKGGVGKTTSVASLGYALSLDSKVLLIDIDAQANLTSSFLGEEQEVTIYEAMRKDTALPIIKITDNLSITPSSLDMASIEIEIASRMQREFVLKELIEKVEAYFDYILIDCPPSLGLVTINAFTAANEVIIPLTAEALPAKGMKMLSGIIEMVQKRLNKNLSISGILITRYEKSKLSQTIEESIRASYGDKVFKTKIRKNISIAESPLNRKSVIEYAPMSNGAKDYLELAEELKKVK